MALYRETEYTYEMRGILHVDENGIWLQRTHPPFGNTINWADIFAWLDWEHYLNPAYFNE